MKLKTLRDLNIWDSDAPVIKAEAIKWVKKGNLGDEDWMYFFNITKEDLK